MTVKEEILDYINRNELTGALLLTGQWGCGKSYLAKEIAKEQNEKKKAAIATISLFGLESASAINKRVKDEYTSFMLGTLGKNIKKVSKALATVAKDGMEVASVATAGMPGLSAASQGLSAAMNYDIFGLIEIRNTVGKDDKERKFVIVFDDLERNGIPTKELLGVLNEYVENKHIRVIVIADEDKISGDEYKEYKEKLISRTIRMTADYGMLIDSIIEGYSETSSGYKDFLKENSALLKQVFTESQSNNLRTLKSAVADFERIYTAWEESGIATDNMKWALYSFAAEMFISKEPGKKEQEKVKIGSQYLFSKEEEKQYLEKGKHQSFFLSFNIWIRSGLWNKESFLQELQQKYAVPELSPTERFLLYSMWALEKTDIEEGLPLAVEQAYLGELSRDNLISLLTKIHVLNEFSIPLPCAVDYKQMENGLRNRINRIKQGSIVEPRSNTFALGDQIDEEAHHFYKMIDNLDNQIAAWKNRKEFIDYISGNSDSPGYLCRGLYIDEFDDELLELFEKRYEQASNEDKREYSGTLLGLIFDCDSYSSEENKKCSRINLGKLIEWLKMQNSDDGIETIINTIFAKQIQDSNLMRVQRSE